MNNTSFYIKRFFTDFIGKVQCVDYVGPYGYNQQYALEAQYQHDMKTSKPDVTQPTYYEWVEVEESIAQQKFETYLHKVMFRTPGHDY